MNKQREKHTFAECREALERCLGRPVPPETKNSGGQYENFREGWARDVMGTSQERVHYFVRQDFAKAKSLCGVASDVRWMYGPGNYEKCAHCRRALKVRQKYHNNPTRGRA